jgi:hypothetical protein
MRRLFAVVVSINATKHLQTDAARRRVIGQIDEMGQVAAEPVKKRAVSATLLQRRPTD